MLKNYKERRAWSDKHLEQVKQLLAPVLITTSSDYDDKHYAVDLCTQSSHIAVRIRHNKYLSKYKDEFTLRASSPKGVESELQKMLDETTGPRYFFYGFADDDTITHAALVDLGIWRNSYKSGGFTYLITANKDGSQFASFRFLPEYTTVLLQEIENGQNV